MVGGTRIHRQIHERALVEMKEREEFLLGEENTSPAARTLFVSLDRADAIIEGGPDEIPDLPCAAECMTGGYHCAVNRVSMRRLWVLWVPHVSGLHVGSWGGRSCPRI